MIRPKEVAAAEALALGRTLHWQTQKFEPPSLQDHSFEEKMTASDPVLNRRLYRICRTAMSAVLGQKL
jgi:hypothetical protein